MFDWRLRDNVLACLNDRSKRVEEMSEYLELYECGGDWWETGESNEIPTNLP